MSRAASEKVTEKKKQKGKAWIYLTTHKLKITLGACLCATFVFMLFGIAYISKIKLTKEDIDKLKNYRPPQATIFFDDKNEIIAEVSDERRIFASIGKIPVNLKNAFIAAEDRSFYTNAGVDFISIMRATMQNAVIAVKILSGKKGERFVGASTITQQVVRNTIITKERTITRKIKEILFSLKISSILSKDEILEIYLNQIYLGSQTYGVVSAAAEYFNKPIGDLTIAECAALASLPKSPSTLNLRKGNERTLERRNWVLQRMLIDKMITKAEYKYAIAEPIVTVTKAGRQVVAWGFLEYVKNTLIASNIDLDNIKTSGYRIYTTMHRKWQNIAQEKLDGGLLKYSKQHGYTGPIAKINTINWVDDLKKVPKPLKLGKFDMAVVLHLDDKIARIGLKDGTTAKLGFETMEWARPFQVPTNTLPLPKKIGEVLSVGDVIAISSEIVEAGEKGTKTITYFLEDVPTIDGGVIIMSPKTGNVFAMVGGYADVPATFNRAFQAQRQAGSIAKSLVYLSALENGIKPNEIFMDSEIFFNLGEGEIWSPKNVSLTYSGPVTLRTGLEKSMNIVTIRIAQATGVGKVIKTFKRFNAFKSYPTNLSISLGTAETTLLDIVRAYGTIANYGVSVKPIVVQKMFYENGDPVETFKKDVDENSTNNNIDHGWISFLSKGEAKEEHILATPQHSYQILSILRGATQAMAVKKRTTEIEDVFFIGKTGTSQDGRDTWFIGTTPDVVIGVYAGFDTPQATGGFGSTIALPIFTAIMNEIKNEIPKDKEFIRPEGTKLVRINKLTGVPVPPNTPLGSGVIDEVFLATDKIIIPSDSSDQEKQEEKQEEDTGKDLKDLEDSLEIGSGIY